MSLSLALTNAISGLNVSQQSIAVISQNIANANNVDYSRQEISQSAINLGGDIGAGVKAEEVTRVVDAFIARSVVERSSIQSRAETISQFHDRAQIFYGSPGLQNSLDIFVNNFFESLENLSTTPENTSLKFNAINAGNVLASEVSDLANNLESLRFEADQAIFTEINNINKSLVNLRDLNAAIISADSTGQSQNSFLDSIDAELKTLASLVDITYSFAEDNTVTVQTTSGVVLLDEDLRQLEYSKTNTISDLVNDFTINPISAFIVKEDGTTDLTSAAAIATGGLSQDVTTVLTGGTIKGLLELRDSIIPELLGHLDNIASTIRDSVNAVHNNGAGFPPPSILTGQTIIDPTARNYWQGEVMITGLDADGTSVSSPYGSQITSVIGYEPLTLDLGSLNDGSGNGRPSFQSIIDEINHHFGVPQDKASLSNLHSVELVSLDDSLAASTGSFDFSLELSNLSDLGSQFRVTAAAATDAALNPLTMSATGGFPTAYETTNPGQKEIAPGLNFAMDMTTPGSGAGPYTITLTVEAMDADGGNVETGTISFTVPETAAALRNDRFPPTGSTGNVVIESPITTQRILEAKLVDANGLEIPKNPTTGDYTASGFLVLEGVNGSRVALSELNSSNKGSDPASLDDTNFGFSHYFGLNNFFNDDRQSVLKNAAYNMSVRDAINSDNGLFSLAELVQSNQSLDPLAPPKYTFEIASGDNQNIRDMANLAVQSINFAASGSIPTISTTISAYAAEVLGFSAATAANAESELEKVDLILQGFISKADSVSGVNIDEELANTIIFQNSYSANARVITTARELFDTLLAAF